MLSSLKHQIATLDSGLTVVVVPMPGVHRVVLDAHLRVGSRYERADENGISHFLEHMLYRGTPRHPSAHAQALAFERLGGTLVAATYVDHMSMAISVPPENFEAVLPLFCEVYRQPIFDGLDIEKSIVREEILEGLDDDGHDVDADNLVRELVFGSHPLGYPITGTIDKLDRFDLDLLKRHHAAHYHGRATVLAVAGPVDAERTLEQVEQCFRGLGPGGHLHVAAPEAQREPRFSFVRYPASSQTALRVVFHAPGENDVDEAATELLLRTLDDGMSTRLYHHICDARGLCYDVSAGYEAYSDTGLVELAAESAHEHAEQVLHELFEVLRDLRDNGPSEEELERAKQRFGWQLTEMLDDPGEVADFFALGQLTGVARTPAERLEQLLGVTREHVRAAAQRIFRRQNVGVVAVGLLSRRTQDALERRTHDFG